MAKAYNFEKEYFVASKNQSLMYVEAKMDKSFLGNNLLPPCIIPKIMLPTKIRHNLTYHRWF